MDDLIIRVPRKPKPRKGSIATRVSSAAYIAADEVAAKSGKPLSEVISAMVLFAAKHTIVEYEEEE